MIHFGKLIRTALLTLALSLLLALGASAVSMGAGTVTADALRLRSGPSVGSNILATAGKGRCVVVLEEAGGWYKVDCGTIEGYMSADYLNFTPSVSADLGYAYINTGSSTLNLRAGAGTSTQRLASIPGSTIVPVCGIDGGWYKVTYGGITGYISSEYALLVRDTKGTRADGNGVCVASSSKGETIAAFARQFIGTPYVYGGNGPNKFDCSGFTKYIFSQFGYSLNRTATNQLSNGAAVSRSQLVPGDLVFFKYKTSKPVSHVGIYIGGGQFIHASTNNYRVCISDMSSGHYSNVYVYARRIA